MGKDIVIKTQADLDAISDLEVIEGDLVLWKTEIKTIALPQLRQVHGDLSIMNNCDLAILSLPSLISVSGIMTATQNSTMSALSAPRLSWIGGSLNILYNEALHTICVAATGIYSGALISKNRALSRVHLSDLEAADSLEIFDNEALRAIDMGSLRSVYDLRVYDNPALERLAVPSLRRVGWSVYLRDNPRLSADCLKISDEARSKVVHRRLWE